jgi:hypothetical protein
MGKAGYLLIKIFSEDSECLGAGTLNCRVTSALQRKI